MLTWIGYYQKSSFFEMTFTSVTFDEEGEDFIAQGHDADGCFRMEGVIQNGKFRATKHHPHSVSHYVGDFNRSTHEINGTWGANEGSLNESFKIVRISDDQVQSFKAMIEENNRKKQIVEDDEDEEMGGLFD